MAMFVHLAPEARIAKIKRNGIRHLRKATRAYPGGIFAVPVTPNFYISHQWLRELRRHGERNYMGVYFRIPDDEKVWLGHYGQVHQELSAAEAVAAFLTADDRQGWQVVITRAVEPKEIHRVRALRQVLGWRVSPIAKGTMPCGCDFCARGRYNASKIRRRYNKRMEEKYPSDNR